MYVFNLYCSIIMYGFDVKKNLYKLIFLMYYFYKIRIKFEILIYLLMLELELYISI